MPLDARWAVDKHGLVHAAWVREGSIHATSNASPLDHYPTHQPHNDRYRPHPGYRLDRCRPISRGRCAIAPTSRLGIYYAPVISGTQPVRVAASGQAPSLDPGSHRASAPVLDRWRRAAVRQQHRLGACVPGEPGLPGQRNRWPWLWALTRGFTWPGPRRGTVARSFCGLAFLAPAHPGVRQCQRSCDGCRSLRASPSGLGIGERGRRARDRPGLSAASAFYAAGCRRLSTGRRCVQPADGQARAILNGPADEIRRIEFYLQVRTGVETGAAALRSLGIDRDGQDGWSAPLNVTRPRTLASLPRVGPGHRDRWRHSPELGGAGSPCNGLTWPGYLVPTAR